MQAIHGQVDQASFEGPSKRQKRKRKQNEAKVENLRQQIGKEQREQTQRPSLHERVISSEDMMHVEKLLDLAAKICALKWHFTVLNSVGYPGGYLTSPGTPELSHCILQTEYSSFEVEKAKIEKLADDTMTKCDGIFKEATSNFKIKTMELDKLKAISEASCTSDVEVRKKEKGEELKELNRAIQLVKKSKAWLISRKSDMQKQAEGVQNNILKKESIIPEDRKFIHEKVKYRFSLKKVNETLKSLQNLLTEVTSLKERTKLTHEARSNLSREDKQAFEDEYVQYTRKFHELKYEYYEVKEKKEEELKGLNELFSKQRSAFRPEKDIAGLLVAGSKDGLTREQLLGEDREVDEKRKTLSTYISMIEKYFVQIDERFDKLKAEMETFDRLMPGENQQYISPTKESKEAYIARTNSVEG